MKKRFIAVLLAAMILMGCGSNMVIDGKEYETIGMVNILVHDQSMMAVKESNIRYRVIWGNVIWGAVLFGSAIAPIYFYGFSMFEPVGKLEAK